MGCLSVREDNARALASCLSYVQVGKHCITFLYYLHPCGLCKLHEICRAKVDKGGIMMHSARQCVTYKRCIPVWAFTDFHMRLMIFIKIHSSKIDFLWLFADVKRGQRISVLINRCIFGCD